MPTKLLQTLNYLFFFQVAMLRGIKLMRKISPLVTSRRIVSTAFNKYLFLTNVTVSLSLSGK